MAAGRPISPKRAGSLFGGNADWAVQTVNLGPMIRRDSDDKYNPAPLFRAVPGLFHLRQRDRFDIDGENALCGEIEDLGDGGEHAVERHSPESAAQYRQVDAAQRGAGQSDGWSSNRAHFDEAGAVRRFGAESFGVGSAD